MIDFITIENYKSVQRLEIPLGRINVLIGANGSGKSNVLEAIALCSAAANNKLDNEFLASRGIRVTDDPRFMRSAFDQNFVSEEIKVSIQGSGWNFECILQKKNDEPYAPWIDKGNSKTRERATRVFDGLLENREQGQDAEVRQWAIETYNDLSKIADSKLKEKFRNAMLEVFFQGHLARNKYELNIPDFLIYSPENTSLRTLESEGQIEPLGIKGEGLLKLLKVLTSRKNLNRLRELKDKLRLIDWFDDFSIPRNSQTEENNLLIKDRYIDRSLKSFTQKSSNEGFLFLLFYFSLLISKDTPDFFAVDNIDASLNPKLCVQLMIEIADLTQKYEKQVILTTHNPAILDGLNLDDDTQRLFVVYRNKLGHTKLNRIIKPKTIEGEAPVKLSEGFLRGYFGGIPKNF